MFGYTVQIHSSHNKTKQNKTNSASGKHKTISWFMYAIRKKELKIVTIIPLHIISLPSKLLKMKKQRKKSN